VGIELSGICKVYEHYTYQTVNQYLAIGWKLLFVGQMNDTETQGPIYVVGWDSMAGEPKEPYSKE